MNIDYLLDQNCNGKKYLHYKGDIYTIIVSALHTEALEELIVYRRDKDETVWARPKNMFFSKIEMNGVLVDRFLLLN